MLHSFYYKVFDIDNDNDNDNDKCFIKHKCIQTTVIQLNIHYMYRKEKIINRSLVQFYVWRLTLKQKLHLRAHSHLKGVNLVIITNLEKQCLNIL